MDSRNIVSPLTSVPGWVPARKPPICDFFALSSGLYACYIFPKVEEPAGPRLYGRHGQVKPTRSHSLRIPARVIFINPSGYPRTNLYFHALSGHLLSSCRAGIWYPVRISLDIIKKICYNYKKKPFLDPLGGAGPLQKISTSLARSLFDKIKKIWYNIYIR
jgi:hypothetical protein